MRKVYNHVVVASAILLLGGIVLILIDQSHTHQFTRYPLIIPISFESGEGAAGSFVAELDEPYDVEIYLRQDIAYEKVRALGMAMERPSDLDMKWRVTQSDRVIASGDCRDYLHIIEQRDSMPARVAKYVLNMPDRQSIAGPPTVARGVGQFKCQASKRYQLTIDVGKGVAELSAGNPEVVVSVNRRYVTRHYATTRYMRVAGVVACSLAGAAWMYLALIRLFGQGTK